MDEASANGQLRATSSGLVILVVDDNPAVTRAMEIALGLAGHQLDTATGPEEAFSRLAARKYDAILLDLNFSPGQSDGKEGLACLERIIADDPAACVIVITAHSGVRIAVAAMKAGARDFVMKPWRNAELVAKVETAVARSDTPSPPRSVPPVVNDPPRLLGDSLVIERVRSLIRRVGPTRASVTITGPSGSGRNLTALAIHAASQDAGQAPLRVDLRDEAAWSSVDDASGTMILRYPEQLDEIQQSRLHNRLPSRVRCLAVVNDTTALIPPLRRRIATLEIDVPPLARRGNDAVVLARHFARLAAERFGRPSPQLSAAAEAVLRSTPWPDEVRGLALAVERAVLLSDTDTLEAATLLPVAQDAAPTPSVGADFDLNDRERALIEAALSEHRHNITHAAAALGLSRGALYRRMARHGL